MGYRTAEAVANRIQPWAAVAGFAFLWHFVWEMWQAPVYRTMVQVSQVEAVRVCSFATLGDALIQLVAFAAAALAAGSRLWLARPRPRTMLPRTVRWLAARRLGFRGREALSTVPFKSGL